MKLLVDRSLLIDADFFAPHFEVLFYHTPQEALVYAKEGDAILCRSTLKIDETFLNQSPIQCIASTVSGSDHIDEALLQKKGIHLITAKGANAHSVADYMLSMVAKLDNMGRIADAKAAVFGCGEVGSQVTSRLQRLGFDVTEYDPPKAYSNAYFQSDDVDMLFDASLICIHANLHHQAPHSTYQWFNEERLQRLRPDAILINAARGEIVDEKALLTHPSLLYCTDVFCNEPHLAKAIVDKALLCTPHIAGHSIDAKDEGLRRAISGMYQYFGLPLPRFTQRAPTSIALPSSTRWQSVVLSLYDPEEESQHLKASDNVSETFQSLRRRHRNRRDFNHYVFTGHPIDETIRPLLG